MQIKGNPCTMLLFSLYVVPNSLATLWTVAARLFCPWGFPGKNPEVGCHFLLQGIFLTQGLNLHLPVSPALQVASLQTKPPGKTKRVFFFLQASDFKPLHKSSGMLLSWIQGAHAWHIVTRGPSETQGGTRNQARIFLGLSSNHGFPGGTSGKEPSC